MPGVRSSRRRAQRSTCWCSSRISGRGPTRLISPRRTFRSCGSSSSETAPEHRPTRVTRGSSRILNIRASPPAAVLVQVRRPRPCARRRRRSSSGTSDRNGSAAVAHPHLPEEHGPGRVELDRERDGERRTARAGQAEHDATTRSIARFMSRDDRESRSGGGRAAEGPRPCGSVVSEPSTSKSRGTMSTWTSSSFRPRKSSSVARASPFENAKITRSTSKRADELGSSAVVAEDAESRGRRGAPRVRRRRSRRG